MSMLRTDSINIERVPLLALALVMSFLTSAQATIINVPADQVTIQAGINSASTGDTVLVAPGYYLENINFQGKEIVVSSHFLLNRDPALIFATTIDGSNPANVDSASTVRIFCTGTEAPVFQGFTVTGGLGTSMRDPTEGQSYRNGGGIATRGGSPVIRFNYIQHNGPDKDVEFGGGGICLVQGNPIVENNFIVSNSGWYGCGIFGRLAFATARNNVIAFNSGGEQWGGAGIYLYGGRLNGYNNTIAFNSSRKAGGGVRVAEADIYLWNSIVWGNEGSGAPQAYIDGRGRIIMQYSDIQGGYVGMGNIDVDPIFSGSWCFTSEGSPCVDAGDPDAASDDLPLPSAPTAARWPSRGGLRNDMGACGGPACYPLALAAINPSENSGWVPWQVGFKAESYFEADSWDWEFGDGDRATGQAVVHTYDDPGVHYVTLTIGHDEGESYVHNQETVCALADTMWAGNVEFTPSMLSIPVEVLVQARNNVPLNTIWIPFAFSGDLQLVHDGFSTVGCRTAGFGTQIEHSYNPGAGTALIELSGNPGLSPGSGPILKLLFHTVSAEDGQSATIALTSDLITMDPQFRGDRVVYQPATIDGSIQCDCCSGRVGNADGLGTFPQEVTIGDIQSLVTAKFISSLPCEVFLDCLAEADVNQSGGANPACKDITISDIQTLVNHLFIAGPANAPLKECL